MTWVNSIVMLSTSLHYHKRNYFALNYSSNMWKSQICLRSFYQLEFLIYELEIFGVGKAKAAIEKLPRSQEPSKNRYEKDKW